jgi:hypothetical protein
LTVHGQLQALTIPASEDATGHQNKITAAANGSSVLMVDPARVAFVCFNLDDIPEGAVVSMARLRLYTSSLRNKGQGLGLHLVTGQWNEAIPGAQPAFERTPFVQIAAANLGSRRFLTVDVIAQVQAWVNSRLMNEGFAVTSLGVPPPGTTAPSPMATVYIASKEGPSLGLPPVLDIEFEDSAATSISTEQLPPAVRDLVGSCTFQTSERRLVARFRAHVFRSFNSGSALPSVERWKPFGDGSGNRGAELPVVSRWRRSQRRNRPGFFHQKPEQREVTPSRTTGTTSYQNL